MKRMTGAFFGALILLLAGCNSGDRKSVQEQANQAKQDTREDVDRASAEARKLGSKAKEEAGKLSHDIHDAVTSDSTVSTKEGAKQKLQKAGNIAKQASTQAGQKLSQASIVAQIKTKLASDIGLNSVSNVKVDVAGPIVTLSGSVQSGDQKQRAEKAASEVDGITKVVNELQIEP